MKKIIVVIEGGIIQDIVGIPPNVVVEVRDWDIDVDDCADHTTFVDGEEVVTTRWRCGGRIDDETR